MRRKPPKNQTPAWLYPKRKRHGITHEKVIAATEDFLSKGGQINVLPPSPDFRHMRNPVRSNKGWGKGLHGNVYDMSMYDSGDVLYVIETLSNLLGSDD